MYSTVTPKAMGSHITFLLNDRDVSTDVSSGTLVLDFLRKEAGLPGTKEGCKEGDCGACSILIGDFTDDRLHYSPVTSCLVPLGEVHGKHVVTIEGLNLPDGLSPLQAAIIDEGGTQCGYCTPGIVVSMTHCAMTCRGRLTLDDMKTALSGHLCRCTGYRSLKKAGLRMRDLWNGNDSDDEGSIESHIPRLIDKGLLPPYFAGIPGRLRAFRSAAAEQPADIHADSPRFRIAGGTDLYVQRGEEIPAARVDVLNRHPGMRTITRDAGTLRIGALTTFEEISRNQDIRRLVPRIEDFMHGIASLQIRNRATLAGNVINASPIGDMTILLLALDADLHLRDGHKTRRMPLRDLYRGYKDLHKEPSEIVTAFSIPMPETGRHVNFEKVSKRQCLDIASVNTAITVTVENAVIRACSLAIGGVAPIPKYLPRASERVAGLPVRPDTVLDLAGSIQDEIRPISDVRGSASYKRLMARQLVIAHFTTLFPHECPVEAFV